MVFVISVGASCFIKVVEESFYNFKNENKFKDIPLKKKQTLKTFLVSSLCHV